MLFRLYVSKITSAVRGRVGVWSHASDSNFSDTVTLSLQGCRCSPPPETLGPALLTPWGGTRVMETEGEPVCEASRGPSEALCLPRPRANERSGEVMEIKENVILSSSVSLPFSPQDSDGQTPTWLSHLKTHPRNTLWNKVTAGSHSEWLVCCPAPSSLSTSEGDRVKEKMGPTGLWPRPHQSSHPHLEPSLVLISAPFPSDAEEPLIHPGQCH